MVRVAIINIMHKPKKQVVIFPSVQCVASICIVRCQIVGLFQALFRPVAKKRDFRFFTEFTELQRATHAKISFDHRSSVRSSPAFDLLKMINKLFTY